MLSIVPTFGLKPYCIGFSCSFRCVDILLYVTLLRIFIACGISAIVRCSSHLAVPCFFGSAIKTVSSYSEGISSLLYMLLITCTIFAFASSPMHFKYSIGIS